MDVYILWLAKPPHPFLALVHCDFFLGFCQVLLDFLETRFEVLNAVGEDLHLRVVSVVSHFVRNVDFFQSFYAFIVIDFLDRDSLILSSAYWIQFDVSIQISEFDHFALPPVFQNLYTLHLEGLDLFFGSYHL